MAQMCWLIWIYTVRPCHTGVYMEERVKPTLCFYDKILVQNGKNFVKYQVDHQISGTSWLCCQKQYNLKVLWRNIKQWQSYSQSFHDRLTYKVIPMYSIFFEKVTQKNVIIFLLTALHHWYFCLYHIMSLRYLWETSLVDWFIHKTTDIHVIPS
jgi:hypothetical protein